MEEDVKIYMVYENDSIFSDGFEFIEREEAINYAIHHRCRLVEELVWFNREDYSNKEPADKITPILTILGGAYD